MFILDSGKFGANPEAAATEVAGVIGKVGGTVVAHRPWQDAKLAYAINGNRKGMYYLAFFTAESTALNDINLVVRLNESVLRHLVLKHDKDLFDRMVEMISGGDAFRLVEGTAISDDDEGRPRRRRDEDGDSDDGDRPRRRRRDEESDD